jgi:hypothetical protein
MTGLLFSVCFASMALGMTNYHLTPPTILPSFAVQEAKEQRRRVLEAVRARRKIIYTRFKEKMQLQTNQGMI